MATTFVGISSLVTFQPLSSHRRQHTPPHVFSSPHHALFTGHDRLEPFHDVCFEGIVRVRQGFSRGTAVAVVVDDAVLRWRGSGWR
jgi:hypothetical protein